MKKGNSMLAVVIVIAIAVILFFVYKSSQSTKPAVVTPEVTAQPAPAPQPVDQQAVPAEQTAPAVDAGKAPAMQDAAKTAPATTPKK